MKAGTNHKPETIQKMKQSHLKYRASLSEEQRAAHRRRTSAAMKASWARRKLATETADGD